MWVRIDIFYSKNYSKYFQLNIKLRIILDFISISEADIRMDYSVKERP